MKKDEPKVPPINKDEIGRNKDLFLQSPQNRIYRSLRDSSNKIGLNGNKNQEGKRKSDPVKKIMPEMIKTAKKRNTDPIVVGAHHTATLAKFAKTRRLSISVKSKFKI